MRYAALAAAVVVTGCTSAPSSPGPSPTPTPAGAALAIESRERYYDIQGSSVPDLVAAMQRLRPQQSGMPEIALTTWDVESTYREGRIADGCALRDARVTLQVTVTLPRWERSPEAPVRLVNSWNSFLAHVKVHEAGHRAIAEEYARRLAGALAALRGTNCGAVWDEAARTVARVVEEGREKNRAYDRETQHGQTQGVVLAP